MPEPLFDSAALSSLLIEVLPAIERDRLAPVLDDLWACGEFSVSRAPRPGLLMCPVRDPFDTEFFLGEVLVTTAEVCCGGRTGHGAAQAFEPPESMAGKRGPTLGKIELARNDNVSLDFPKGQGPGPHDGLAAGKGLPTSGRAPTDAAQARDRHRGCKWHWPGSGIEIA
jgi:hypothetical protein